MKYALAKLRVYLLEDRPFIVYTDHASLRTAVNSSHLSQRMARWLSFFAEYQFFVEYKPGRLNVDADALSRRPNFKPAVQNSRLKPTVSTISVLSSTLLDDIRKAYQEDKALIWLMDNLRNPSEQSLKVLSKQYRSSTDRYSTRNGLLYYTAIADDTPRIVIPTHNDLRLRVMYDCHDEPICGHR